MIREIRSRIGKTGADLGVVLPTQLCRPAGEQELVRRWVSILISDSFSYCHELEIRDVEEWKGERKEGAQIGILRLKMFYCQWWVFAEEVYETKGWKEQWISSLPSFLQTTVLQKTAGWLSTMEYTWKESGSEPRHIYEKKRKKMQ